MDSATVFSPASSSLAIFSGSRRPATEDSTIPANSPVRAKGLVGSGFGWAMAVVPLYAIGAGTMAQDPHGFQNIPWGARLAELPGLQLADPGERITGFEFTDGPPRLGQAQVDSVRLSAIEGKFARAAVHYNGRKTHELIMSYLESQFGPIDRSPGSMVRGLNQQYNWRGDDTEINVIYQSFGERGVVFLESRELAPRFNDTLSETAY
jgi:hypothetical protein